MQPISSERVEWIEGRLKVLDATRRTLTTRMALYRQQTQLPHDIMVQAMNTLRSEELLLLVERDTLLELLKEPDNGRTD